MRGEHRSDDSGGEAALEGPGVRDAGWTQRLGWAALEWRFGEDYRAAQRRPMAAERPLRVLRVVSSLTQGGVGKVALQTVLAMDRAEAATTLLAFGEKPRHVEAFAAKVNVPVMGVALRLAPYEPARAFGRGVKELARRIEATQAQVVHVHEPQFILAARAAVGMAARRGTPARLVAQLHNDYRRRSGAMPESLMPAIRRGLGEAALIACSRSIEAAARDWLGEGARPALIEDGADDRVIGGADAGDAAAIERAAAGRAVVACMANLLPHKRIEDFIEACGRLIDEGAPVYALLMVYGKKEAEAATRRRFEARIPEGAGRMLYRVGQPHGLLRAVTVGVSTSELEGLGLNILEYQAQGIPVVCSDLAPHREMVEDGVSGLLFPVGDVGALAGAVRRLIEDEGMRGRIGAAGREAAGRRKWGETAKRTVELYRRLMGG